MIWPPDPPGDGEPPDELPYDPPRGVVPDGSPYSPDEVAAPPKEGVGVWKYLRNQRLKEMQDLDEVLPDVPEDISPEGLARYKEFLWDAEQWLMT